LPFKLPPQAWYIFGASSNEKRNLMPNHLMQWTMMQWAKDNGCTSYDFRGVPDPALRISPHMKKASSSSKPDSAPRWCATSANTICRSTGPFTGAGQARDLNSFQFSKAQKIKRVSLKLHIP
jgi:hypothetical protein